MKPATPATRYPFIDILRGLAIAMMFVFHFTFDLNYFGYVSINFLADPFWLNFRRLIVTSFLLLVGISLYLATRNGVNRPRFLRRLALLVFYALLVSAGSYLMFPATFIYFGILHFIAAASILGLLFTHFYWLNLLLGTGLILLDTFYSNSFFNDTRINWIGLMTYLPATEDYVPLIPWFGVVLVGMFVGRWLFTQQLPASFTATPRNPLLRTLAFAGRHSIHIYMLHQPIFIGLLALLSGTALA